MTTVEHVDTSAWPRREGVLDYPHGGCDDRSCDTCYIQQVYSLDDLRDPATIVDALKALGWHKVQESHTPDCFSPHGSGIRCNCVPDPPTWSAPSNVYDFLGEDWDSRLARAKARKDPDDEDYY